MVHEIVECRICASSNLEDFLSLGKQALTGVFPANASQKETFGPLVVTRCATCGLVQLRHSFPMDEMYGDNYGYRSGLNASMVRHLKSSVNMIKKYVNLSDGDLVIDIGSNDATLLKAYGDDFKLQRVGVDPVGEKFKEYYPSNITLVADFFPSETLNKKIGNKKAKVITSFSCFYDLEAPMDFARKVAEHLDENTGVWVLEQSYLPLMVERMSYDTICHEHLEYYCMRQIHFIAEIVGLKVLDIQFNGINGGSFCVTLSHKKSKHLENAARLSEVLSNEKQKGCETMDYYREFSRNVFDHRESLLEKLNEMLSSGKEIVALGASTKGNVLLQYCQLNKNIIKYVGEINPYKFGRVTPGTHIPICNEVIFNEEPPDCKLVLPWHFRESFLEREATFLSKGGSLLFPFPKIELVTKDDL